MKYTIEINGYGGEVVLGKLTKEQYDYWIDHADRESEELHSHLFWDPWSDEDGNPITDDEDPRWLGQWYEIDSEAHVCNALHDNCRAQVDEDGNDVMEEDDVEIASTTFSLKRRIFTCLEYAKSPLTQSLKQTSLIPRN